MGVIVDDEGVSEVFGPGKLEDWRDERGCVIEGEERDVGAVGADE